MPINTIPADTIVRVTPNVLSAGGNALDLNGLFLTSSTRVPIGTVLSFPNAPAVAAFFGGASDEFAKAAIYFNGFDNSNVKPGAILFAQYNQGAVAGYLRGANVSGLTLLQLQALSGALVMMIDGYSRNGGTISLAAATSFSSAAGIIQTGLNSALPTQATLTGSIAPATASFTGSIAGTILTVSAIASGNIVVGQTLSGTGGGGVTALTKVLQQLTGSAGGVGTYIVSASQIVLSTAIAGAYGILTVSAVASGTLAIGQTVVGTGVTVSTQIVSLISGTGGTGTYAVDVSQTAISAAMTTAATGAVVTYDSTSGAFVISSGVLGAVSSVNYPTGALATLLSLTSATGATLSQGAAPATSSEFMTALTIVTQDWATFMLLTDPDGGSGNVTKLAFALWTSQQNNRYCFVCWDTDASPTATVPATSSLGYLLAQSAYSGTALVYNNASIAAFVCGSAASIDFTERKGRATFAFKSQSGLTPTATDATTAANLAANGYNYYGVWATANDEFIFFNKGVVSGLFVWLDSFVNQIWLNNQFQLALMVLLTQVKSIPYNSDGYDLIRQSLMDTINQGLNFGAFRAGVTLSSLQAAEVNNAAGLRISETLNRQGWYLQILDALPQVRQARGSPPCTFWYMDGESVQTINLASILLQ